MAPSNATNVASYAWTLNGEKIDGATEATYTIPTTAKVGDKYNVIVTDADGKEFTSPDDAVVTAASFTVEAKQGGAKKVTVTLSEAIGDTAAIVVNKGSVEQTISAKEVSEDKKTVTLELGANINAAEYTVKVTATDGGTANGSFTGEASALTTAKAVKNELIKGDVLGTTATTTVKGYNQWDEEVALDAQNVTATKMSTATAPTYTAKTGVITLTAQAGNVANYTTGESVTITFTYANNAKVFSEAFTVVDVATVASMEFGDVTPNAKSLVGSKVFKKNLNKYYVPVTAKDQYGNELTKDQLSAMVAASRLFCTPNSGMIAIIDADPFIEVDGKPAIQLKNNTAYTLTYGTATISVLSVGGSTFTKDVVVEDEPNIDTLTVTIDDLYASYASTVTLDAVDQYGDPVDLYNTTITGGTDTLTIAGTDASHVTTIDAKGTWVASKDTSKKAWKITFNPGVETYETFVVQTSTHKVNTIGPKKVGTAVTPADIKGVKDTVPTSITATQQVSLAKANIEFLNSAGSVMTNTTDGVTAYPDIANTTTEITSAKITAWDSTDTAASYHYTITPVATNSIFSMTAAGAISVTNSTALTEATTEQFTITLYAGNANSLAGSTHFKEIASKKISITAQPASTLTYALENSKSATIDASQAGKKVTLSLTATDSEGNKTAVDIDELKSFSISDSGVASIAKTDYSGSTATAEQALTLTGINASSTHTGDKASGTVTVKALIGANSQEVSIDVPYSTAAPVATDLIISTKAVYQNPWEASSTRAIVEGTTIDNVKLAASSGATALEKADGDDYFFIMVDQYGNPVGSPTTSDAQLTGWTTTDATAKALGSTGLAATTAGSNAVTGVVTINGTNASRTILAGDSFSLTWNYGKLYKTINVNISDANSYATYKATVSKFVTTSQGTTVATTGTCTAFVVDETTAKNAGDVFVVDQYGTKIETGTIADTLTVYSDEACTTAVTAAELSSTGAAGGTLPTATLTATTNGQVQIALSINAQGSIATAGGHVYCTYGGVVYTMTLVNA